MKIQEGVTVFTGSTPIWGNQEGINTSWYPFSIFIRFLIPASVGLFDTNYIVIVLYLLLASCFVFFIDRGHPNQLWLVIFLLLACSKLRFYLYIMISKKKRFKVHILWHEAMRFPRTNVNFTIHM